jgi:hypothetical protein
MNDILYILLILLVVLFCGLAFISYKFYQLQDVVILSFKDAFAMFILISRYKHLENPEKYIARFSHMSEEEAKLELDRGHLMDLLSIRAMSIIATMKASVKGSAEMVANLEDAFEKGE